jgi:hypothetical protein
MNHLMKVFGLAAASIFLIALSVYSAGIPFDNYHFFIKLELGGGGAFGDLMQKEHDAFKLVGVYSDGTRLEGQPEHTGVFGLLGGEFLWNRFGFNVAFISMPVYQSTSIGNKTYEKKSYSGNLISTTGLMTGFNYYFLLGDLGDWGTELYLGPKIGYVWGKLYPYPSASEYYHLSLDPFDVNGLSLGGTFGYQMNYYNFLWGASLSYYYNIWSSLDSLSLMYKGLDKSINNSMVIFSLYIGLGF